LWGASHLKVKRQRKDTIDKIVDYLVKQYDLIAIEDLKPTNMVRNKHLSKSILDAGWGYFRERLNSKAVDAGCTVRSCRCECGKEHSPFSLKRAGHVRIA